MYSSGWLQDAGGLTRTYEVETEEGDIDVVTVKGQGYLKDTGIDMTGGTIVINWGKQMSEAGYIRKHDVAGTGKEGDIMLKI
jgi:hypothetical protein